MFKYSLVQRAGPFFDFLLQRLVVLVTLCSPAVFLSSLHILSHRIGLWDGSNNNFLAYRNTDVFERVLLPMVLVFYNQVL